MFVLFSFRFVFFFCGNSLRGWGKSTSWKVIHSTSDTPSQGWQWPMKYAAVPTGTCLKESSRQNVCRADGTFAKTQHSCQTNGLFFFKYFIQTNGLLRYVDIPTGHCSYPSKTNTTCGWVKSVWSPLCYQTLTQVTPTLLPGLQIVIFPEDRIKWNQKSSVMYENTRLTLIQVGKTSVTQAGMKGPI